ncbi:MAG: hypothetical protein ACOZF2_00115 [Thermodesulfobacteriota bacterium]
MPQKSVSQDQDQDVDQLKEQVESLTCELLKERITRLDFQVQLLTQWRQQSQQELNQLLSRGEGSQSPEK